MMYEERMYVYNVTYGNRMYWVYMELGSGLSDNILVMYNLHILFVHIVILFLYDLYVDICIYDTLYGIVFVVLYKIC